MNLIEKLREKQYSISTAESVTAGLIAARICDISGASAVFNGGVVSYSKEAKCKLLGLKMEDIEAFCVYSEETAISMAKGVKKLTNSDVAISITGVAGPGSDENVEAGTLYYAFIVEDRIISEEKFFNGDRQEVRDKAASYAIKRIEELLEKNC